MATKPTKYKPPKIQRTGDRDISAPLHPHFFYRKNSAVALNVIGLSPSQTDEAIQAGDVPRPVNITANGRACGWLGSQLIELQQRRLAAVKAAEASGAPVRKPAPPRKAKASADGKAA